MSTFFTDNTLNARRNLRSKIERRSLLINEDFLSAFREVKSSLDGIYNDVLAMNSSVQTMTNQLQSTKTRTLQLIDQTSKLQNHRFVSLFFVVVFFVFPSDCESRFHQILSRFYSQKLSMQQEVANAFIKNFQLSQSELSVLHGPSREAPITNEFFVVADRVQVIHTLYQFIHQYNNPNLFTYLFLQERTRFTIKISLS